ncbi:hypothetical protein [Oligosphaera ethanolica]|uniref:Uncharacterized protein n=1 Tax=Oligosphaera ethanolica TaxID=760260 RepID=A0AAE4AMM4_9BACT|nr:hypothetical protein [Oligosphaera ethanolica]MDQ0288013.1 hypothetical protein [Oligosphaera ethanolica]
MFINYVYSFQRERSLLKCIVTDHHVTRREAAEALKARNIPAQDKQALKARAALGITATTFVFLGLFGPGRRS